MADYFYELEDRDGVRFSWNMWPSSRIEYKKIVIPIACMYTPLKRITEVPVVNYTPVHCGKCSAYLNPYCSVEFQTKTWNCPFCFTRNPFPSNYAGMDPQHLVAELFPENTTIEYRFVSHSQVQIPPVFLFVVDTAISHADELEHLKQSLFGVLEVLPQNAFVGLITYGANVQVYELSYPFCRRCIVFSGETELPSPNIQTLLNIPISSSRAGTTAAPQLRNKYILPYSETSTVISSIIKELQQDAFPFQRGEQRRLCATGVALGVSLALMESLFPKTGGRVIVLSAGPCTVGPGLIVSRDLTEPIRSHHHLRKEEAKHVTAATAYYSKLASRAVVQGHVVDIFSASLDQTGILEMHSLADKTGGVIVSTESFLHPIIKQSLIKLFNKDSEGHLNMKFNGTLETICSREIKICGAIGHLQSLEKKSSYVSDSVIGIGGTSSWKMCTLDPNNSYAIYFEVVNPHNNIIPQDHYGVIQFKTNYQHPSGDRILRVTTVAKQWIPPSSTLHALLPGFDQEAAAALIARYAVYRAETEETQPVRWIDRHLIQFIHQFSMFQKDVPDSFTLPPQISIYPEFMFHLRRGNLIQVFGNSPDETSYFRHYLLREDVANCLIMIQPSLDAYMFSSEQAQPSLLSLSSIAPDRILLLDTFFHVVVFSGETIAAWKKAGYQDQAGYENFKQLLEAPLQDATDTIDRRFPTPIHVVCDQGSSQARFLLAVLDPGTTSSSPFMSGAGVIAPGGGGGGGVASPSQVSSQEIHSDDVPLNLFMEHLKKKVVSYEG